MIQLFEQILPSNTIIRNILIEFMMDDKEMVSHLPIDTKTGNTAKLLIMGIKRIYKKKTEKNKNEK